MTKPPHLVEPAPDLPRQVSIWRWFAVYGLYLAALAIPLAVMISRNPAPYKSVWHCFVHDVTTFKPSGLRTALHHVDPAAKLLILAIYLSVLTTFTPPPIPSASVLAIVATRSAGLGLGLWPTVFLLATVGGIAAMMANLTDYHVFLWILRSRHVAKIRNTRTYQVAAKWFQRGPFAILVIFNIIPIPVDVARMLAATYGYSRIPFAASNFIGRFIRFAVIAGITYELKREYDWVAPVAFLVLGVVIAVVKFLPAAIRAHRGTDESHAAGGN